MNLTIKDLLSIPHQSEQGIAHRPDPVSDRVEPFRERRRHAGASGFGPFDRLRQSSPQLFKPIPLRHARRNDLFDPLDQRIGVSAC